MLHQARPSSQLPRAYQPPNKPPPAAATRRNEHKKIFTGGPHELHQVIPSFQFPRAYQAPNKLPPVAQKRSDSISHSKTDKLGRALLEDGNSVPT